MPVPSKTIDPTKVAIYIRWSTEDQGDGTTLEVQMENCTHYVKSQGWAVNPELIIVDDGYSGGSLDRPGMSRLRRMVKAGEIDCVVVFKLDRLSRNVVDTVNLVLREWEGRCYLKSARESIDTMDHAGKMFFYTLVSFAEWERNTIRDRTFSGRLKRAQEGRNPGRKLPYGYASGERRGEIAVVPAQAEVVRQIFQQYITGDSARGIAMKLNEQGIPGPEGGAWGFPTVSRLLKQEMYTGKFVWGSVTRMPRDRPEGVPQVVPNEKPFVILENALPPIISQEDFALAQAMRRQRPNPRKGEGGGRSVSSDYLLSGVLQCGLCGKTMRARPPYHSRGRYYSTPWYYCIARFHSGAAVCDSSYVRCDELDRLVVEELKARYGGREQREDYIKQYLSNLSSEIMTLQHSLGVVEKQLQHLGEEEAHVRKHFRQRELSLEEYRQMMEDLKRESEEIRVREQTLQTQLQDLRATVGGQEYLMRAAREVDQWEELDPKEQKRVLRFFIKRVRAYRRPRSPEVACEITWKTDESRPGES